MGSSWELDQKEPPEHGDKAQGIQSKAPTDPQFVDHDAADGRPDHPRQIEAARVERDRRLQVISSHKLDDHALTGRDFERRAKSLDSGQENQDGDGHHPRRRERPEDQRLDQKNGLRDADQLEPVAPIDERAGVH